MIVSGRISQIGIMTCSIISKRGGSFDQIESNIPWHRRSFDWRSTSSAPSNHNARFPCCRATNANDADANGRTPSATNVSGPKSLCFVGLDVVGSICIFEYSSHAMVLCGSYHSYCFSDGTWWKCFWPSAFPREPPKVQQSIAWRSPSSECVT